MDALPLARRLEALRRAALNPLGATHRLLRILHRRNSVEAIAEKFAQATRSYASRRTKPGDLAVCDVIDLVVAATIAWRDRYAPPPLALDSS